jgi:hypothetical protein
LFLLIQWRPGAHGAPGCGHKEFKRPPETSAGTARDYSTTFGAACKRPNHSRSFVYLSQRAGKRKKNSNKNFEMRESLPKSGAKFPEFDLRSRGNCRQIKDECKLPAVVAGLRRGHCL